MDIGTRISGLAHLGFIGFALIDGLFDPAPPPPAEFQEVSLVTAEEFISLTEAGPVPETELPQPAPIAVPPENSPDPPEPENPPAPVEPPERRSPFHHIEPPEPESEPDATEIPVTTTIHSETQAPGIPTPEAPVRFRSDRSVLRPVAPPPPDAVIDIDTKPQIAPDSGAEALLDLQEATAREAANDQVVTEAEAENTPKILPAVRPAPRPQRLALPREPAAEQETVAERETVTEQVSPAEPEETTENMWPAETPTPEETPPPAPAGPPLTIGEKDSLRHAIESCWNRGALSTDADRITVVIGLRMARDGKPETGSIRKISSSGGSPRSETAAYETAKRAILRCSTKFNGFDLPEEKYDHWKEIEITFNPQGTQLR